MRPSCEYTTERQHGSWYVKCKKEPKGLTKRFDFIQLCYRLTPEMKETPKMANNCRVTQQKTAVKYRSSREGCCYLCSVPAYRRLYILEMPFWQWFWIVFKDCSTQSHWEYRNIWEYSTGALSVCHALFHVCNILYKAPKCIIILLRLRQQIVLKYSILQICWSCISATKMEMHKCPCRWVNESDCTLYSVVQSNISSGRDSATRLSKEDNKSKLFISKHLLLNCNFKKPQ